MSACLALSAAAAVSQGQTVQYLYDWDTVANHGTGASAFGTISVWDNGQVDIRLYNDSSEPAYVTGFWLYKPTGTSGLVDLRAVDPVSYGDIWETLNPGNTTDWLGTNWDVQVGNDITPSVRSEFGTRDYMDFVGIKKASNPNVDTIGQGYTGKFSFFFDTTSWPAYPGAFESHEFYPHSGTISAPDIVIRMQSVGVSGNDSDKLRAVLIGPPSLVPEPSTVGMLGVAGIGLLIFIRRRFKAKK